MPFTEHLAELRTRLIRALLATGAGFLVAWLFKEPIFHVLMGPLRDALGAAAPGAAPLSGSRQVVLIGVADLFLVYLRQSFVVGLLLASPLVFLELWRFVAPGLYAHERRYVVPVVGASTACFLTGALFGYAVAMPFAFRYLLGLATPEVGAALDVKQNFSFALQFLLVFGIVFELPIAIFFLARLGIVDPATLLGKWRYVVVGSFVVAAPLTPPDPFSQAALAVPLVLLYLGGAGIAYWVLPRRPLEPAPGASAEAPAGDSAA